MSGPTWNALKMVLLMLSLCLVAMFSLAFTCRDFALILHIGLLVILSLGLFLLLSRELANQVSPGYELQVPSFQAKEREQPPISRVKDDLIEFESSLVKEEDSRLGDSSSSLWHQSSPSIQDEHIFVLSHILHISRSAIKHLHAPPKSEKNHRLLSLALFVWWIRRLDRTK
ncbi:hypothetical protein Dimus_032738 [Dionaea muscipula]